MGELDTSVSTSFCSSADPSSPPSQLSPLKKKRRNSGRSNLDVGDEEGSGKLIKRCRRRREKLERSAELSGRGLSRRKLPKRRSQGLRPVDPEVASSKELRRKERSALPPPGTRKRLRTEGVAKFEG